MKKIFILLLCVFAMGINAQLQPKKNTLTVDGKAVWVYTPSDYDATKTYPIVFELHGMRQTKDNMDDQGVVNEQQYIAVYPEGEKLPFISGRVWNSWSETNVVTGGANHVTFLTNVYNAVQQKVGTSFDADKVFVYGYSNGGAMAMKMLEETDLFKGAVIRSMTLKKGHTISSTASKVPMLFIHGVNDATVPYQGGTGNYGSFLSPNFMGLKKAVSKWATHNGASTVPMDIHYLDASNTVRPDFWFREYINTSVNAPVYLFAITNGGHGTEGFTNRNIKRSAIRLFKKPQCYGLSRNSENCQ